jgi:hypothetical protein
MPVPAIDKAGTSFTTLADMHVDNSFLGKKKQRAGGDLPLLQRKPSGQEAEMEQTPQTKAVPAQKYFSVSAYVALLIVFWTAAVAASLFFNIHRTYEYAGEYALIQARTAFEKDIVYRRWNSRLGGVYPAFPEKPNNELGK